MDVIFADLADGLYSTSAAGTDLVATYADQSLTFHGGFDASDNWRVTAVDIAVGGKDVLAITLAKPLTLFAPVAEMGTQFAFAWPETLRMSYTGSNAEDRVVGSYYGDLMKGKGGDDMFFGSSGDDTIFGGNGMDLLLGSLGDDTLNGGKGHDFLITGSDNNTASGGNGNDVLMFTDGQNVARGGGGNDIFIFNSFASSGSATPTVLRTMVRDYNAANDVLIFADADVTLPTDSTADTLADLPDGTIDGFTFTQTKRGLQIKTGDATVILRNTTAQDVDIDNILFAELTASEIAGIFDDTGTGQGLIATGLGGDSLIAFGAETTTFHSTGEGGDWNLFSGDILGFASTAGGTPTV
jgi:Ca2+-binding RTX toxin-like protein